MKSYHCSVIADFFDIVFYDNNFSVYCEALFLQSFGYLNAIYRAEYYARRACLSADSERKSFELLSESLSVGFDFSELVCTLFLVFGQYFPCRFACYDSLTGRDKVISAISVFYLYYIVFISEILKRLL